MSSHESLCLFMGRFPICKRFPTIINLSLLTVAVALTSFILVVTVTRHELTRSLFPQRKASATSYGIKLPHLQRAGSHFSCVGAIVGKRSILTSSPCRNKLTRLKLSGRFVKITEHYSTEMFTMHFHNFTLVRPEDSQLILMKLPVDVTKSGWSILQIPPLNYSVVYQGLGVMLYLSLGQMKETVVKFIHPYYCHLAYEQYMHDLDFNVMICAITEHGENEQAERICMKEAIGSPVIQEGVVVGILTTSLMDTCGERSKPFVFINIIPYLQWFEAHDIKYT